MEFGERAIETGLEAVVTGAWLALVPGLLLVLVATAGALDAATLRRAFTCTSPFSSSGPRPSWPGH